MGDKVLLTVEERQILGKKVRQLRKQGYVPAVVYGHDIKAKPVMAPAQAAAKAWREAGKHHPIELTIGSTKKLAMIKSADLHPVKHNLRHLSLHVVKQNEKVETEVPIRIRGEGETEAEKAGLVVLQQIESVQIAALPKDLPDFMEIDGAKMVAEPGVHVAIADLIPIAGVTILSDPDQQIATVYEPSALAAQNEQAAGEATEDTEVEAENGGEGETTAEEDETATPTGQEKS